MIINSRSFTRLRHLAQSIFRLLARQFLDLMLSASLILPLTLLIRPRTLRLSGHHLLNLCVQHSRKFQSHSLLTAVAFPIHGQ